LAQDANVNAILFGIAPANRVPGIIAALKQNLGTPYGALDVSSPPPSGYKQLIGPFMGSYEVWSLFAAGATNDALNLIDQEWGPMTQRDPGDTTWESMGPTGTQVNSWAWSPPGGVSMAHGWSTGPTSALSEYVLGIRPNTAGYQSWLVAPQPGSLKWAQGSVPTPHGAISVKWGRSVSTGQFSMQVTVPKTTTSGTIDVPTFGKQVTITMNGHTVWNGRVFSAAPGIAGAQVQGNSVALKVNVPAIAPTSGAATLTLTSSTAS
jgi:alpha-L-rhamnosidase